MIASFVTIVDMVMKGFFYEQSKALSIFIPLIVVNCIIMGRAEAFALHNRPVVSTLDGVANGLGYAMVLGLVGFFRELVGSGTLFGVEVLSGEWYTPNQLVILAPGAFIVLGLLMALFRQIGISRKAIRPDEVTFE